MNKAMLSGESYFAPEPGYALEECCDCGLIHLICITRVTENGKQGYRVYSWRDDWHTKLSRIERRKRMRKKKK